ncbi:response regulator [Telmatobacter bradus]|uniref:response regulator n=1 Tax=Telmatobacter bradus TaxID=474953 RepID=UPI003B4337E8
MKTVLLVEDNESDVDLTRRALQKGHIEDELVVAEDGQIALEYLLGIGAYHGRDVNKTPAVVLLDLKLPRISGLEVLKRIRQEERIKHLPVVVLTTSSESADLTSCYRLGANSYLRKPVDFTEFSESVNKICFYWLKLNRHPYEA